MSLKSEVLESEIREMEERGFSVVATDSQGRLLHATESGDSAEYCDMCPCLRFMPDPDPTDWFRDNDKKAICTEMSAMIAGSLEPHEMTKIYKPLWCPKLGRELTEEEKEEANWRLEYGRKNI